MMLALRCIFHSVVATHLQIETFAIVKIRGVKEGFYRVSHE